MKSHGWAVLVVGLLFGAGAAKKDPVADEAEKFRGSWAIASLETDGATHAEAIKQVRYVFDGREYSMRLGDETPERGTFRLDPTQVPRTIELAKKGAEHTALGIYDIDGDQLRICFDPSGQTRPKAFKAGGDHVLLVLKRDRVRERTAP